MEHYSVISLLGTTPMVLLLTGRIRVANLFSNNVTKLREVLGLCFGTFPVGTVPIGVGFDGANIWVANNLSNTVSKM